MAAVDTIPTPATAPIDDSMQAHISPDCPDDTQLLLQTAWARDLSGIKPLLDEPGRASSQDPRTGETPLHAAIRGCGPAPASVGDDNDNNNDDAANDALKIEEAAEVVHELFLWGAIWNDVDARDETPGCLAWRLGRTKLYNLCVDAGVRAELLFGLMGGYEELGSDGDESEEGDAEMLEAWVEDGEGGGEEGDSEEAPQLQRVAEGAADAEDEHKKEVEVDKEKESLDGPATTTSTTTITQPPEQVTSERYLQSDLTLTSDKLLDADLNGVMMSWETPIMERTVAALLPGTPPPTGKRILNIGFGMGIIDTLFAATRPSRHHIIEAHPSVLARLGSATDIDAFGPAWEASGPSAGAFRVHPGRWQDVVPALLAAGEVYDVVYFDTFGEDYAQLRRFFTEMLPGLLDSGGVFGYFNGCGADRRICYDVYARVAEAHLAEAGLDVEWIDVDVDVERMGGEGEGEWEGVRRRYWTLEKYRLPVCTWMG